MEHASISPASASPAPFAAIPLPLEVQSALALHGLRELLFAPIPVLAEALAHFDKQQLGQAIEVMLAVLDATDGDPDAEDADPAGQCDEDGINTHFAAMRYTHGAGCEIGDPGGDEHDGREPDGDEY